MILQIGITLAIVVNSMFIIKQRIDKINRPTGIDIDHIIVAEVRGFGDNYDAVASIEQDLNAIRSMPGVSAVSVTNQVPLSGSGSATGFRTVPDLNVTATPTARYRMSEFGLDALGTSLIAGRNFYPEEVDYYVPGKTAPSTPAGILVTRALADKLYPDGNALGKPIYWGSLDTSTIIGIIGHMQGAWVDWDELEQVTIQPGIPAFDRNRYLIRTLPGDRDRLLPLIEEKLAEVNPQRVINYVRTHRQIVDRTYQVDRLIANILIIVIILLIGLTSLVIVGLVSYFVTQRTRQIGTRRALGATQFDILRYFLTENWIITTAGAVLGSMFTIAVSYLMESSFSLPRLDMSYLLLSIPALWLVSQFAAWFPARRAAAVSPAVATRTV